MSDEIIDRIERASGVPDLVEILASRLAPTDLQSLLLEVYRRRTSRITPAQLLDDYKNNRFVRPAHVAPQRFSVFESLVWSHLPETYVALELSPVTPLGTSSVVATIDQNRVVSTARNTEVVSDVTNVLALECACRRQSLLQSDPKNATDVGVVAALRVVRGQRFDSTDSFSHFGLLGICTAGRDEGSCRFEMRALHQQLEFLIGVLREVPTVSSARVAITDLEDGRHKRQLEDLLSLAGANVAFDDERVDARGYYATACFKIYVTTPDGDEHEVVDGGFTNWTQLLLSNAKERLLISGLGIDRVL